MMDWKEKNDGLKKKKQNDRLKKEKEKINDDWKNKPKISTKFKGINSDGFILK